MIGTAAAILGAAAIGGVASVASGFIGSNAASQAAGAQEDAAVQAARIQADSASHAADIQNAQYEQSRADTLPWLDAGKKALVQLQGEMGLNGAGFKSQFTATPGYQFQVDQGERGVVNNLAALGLKGSGAALKALTKFREGLANSTYQNYLSGLSSIAGTGQTQANDNAAAGATNANNVANGVIGVGNAQANGITDAAAARGSGYVGGANAWTNALGNIGNNFGNALGYASAYGKVA